MRHASLSRPGYSWQRAERSSAQVILTDRRAGRGWLILWAIMLAGYALFGRGFAYLGIPPLFIGELTLAAGVLVVLRCSG